jgi:hypothetical protein
MLLNNMVTLNIASAGRPAACWWNGTLWIAYRALANQATAARIDFSVNPVTRMVTATALTKPLGVTSSDDVAMCVYGGQLQVTGLGPDGQAWITQTADGVTFAAAVGTGIFCDAPLSLAASGSNLFMAWMENTGEVHLARAADGVTFIDSLSSARTRTPPALVSDDDMGGSTLMLGWCERNAAVVGGGPGSPSIAQIDAAAPFNPALPGRLTLDEPVFDHLALAFGAHHDTGRIVAAWTDAATQQMSARQIPLDLSAARGLERGTSGLGLAFARTPTRLYAVWNDPLTHAALTVAPYDLVFDIPRELRDLLGKDCDPNVCPTDERLMCAALDEIDWIIPPARIRNARKGDIVLSPASGTGSIGSFLAALDFPQHFDHSGIVLDDGGAIIRQCTMSQERLNDKKRYVGKILGLVPAPVNGFRQDMLKYGWPGTITQTAQNAFFDGWNDGWNPEWDFATRFPGVPAVPDPGPDASADAKAKYNADQTARRGFLDPESSDPADPKTWTCTELLAHPEVSATDLSLLPPLLVKPPEAAEVDDPDVRATLRRVADAMTALRGHYRFFSYSRAAIAGDPAFLPPPSGAAWAGLPAGADWAVGTRPMVCSSTIWQAVQTISAQRNPILKLDRLTPVTAEAVARDLAPTGMPIDGLYRYREPERMNSARALHEHFADEVRKTVWNEIMDARDDLPSWLESVVRFGVAGIMAYIAGVPEAIAALVGLTPSNAADLALALVDVPDHVANQMGMGFAFDVVDQPNSTAYMDAPREGSAVAPQDMANLWTEPTGGLDHRTRRGLWGSHEPMLCPNPFKTAVRKHVLARARGLWEVEGTVTMPDGSPAVNASVSIGCEHIATDRHGIYHLLVPGGPCEVAASKFWESPPSMLEGKLYITDVAQTVKADIMLLPPPKWRRKLQAICSVRMTRHVFIGHDDVLHPNPTNFFVEFQVAAYSKMSGSEAGAASKPDDLLNPPPFFWLSDFAGNKRARLVLKCTLDPTTLAITATALFQITRNFSPPNNSNKVDPGDSLQVDRSQSVTVPEDGIQKDNFLTIDLETGDAPADEAHIRIEFNNLAEVAT